MKKILSTFLVFTVMGLGACQYGDGFLDEQEASAGGTFGALRTVDDISAIVAGAYWQMVIGRSETAFRQPIPMYMSWMSLASDAFHPSEPLRFPVSTGDGNFVRVFNRERDHLNNPVAEGLYEHCYNIISTLNQGIELVENPPIDFTQEVEANRLDSDPDFDIDQRIAELYALRALNYFMIYQIYGPKYIPGGDNSRPSIMLRSRNTTSFDGIFLPRSSVQEVVDFIIGDLETALSYYKDDIEVGRMSKGAAYAYLARMYLDMNDWENARDYADSVIMFDYNLENRPIDAFNHTDLSRSDEVVFEIQCSFGHNWEGARGRDFVSENTPLLQSHWNWIERRTMGQRAVNNKTYTVDNVAMRSYAISDHVMELMGWFAPGSDALTTDAQNDLRAQQIYHYAPAGTDTRMTDDPAIDAPPTRGYMWVFKDARSATDNVLDGNDFTFELYEGRAHLPVVRLSEMYLTRAIANARLGNEGLALQDLNAVKEARWDTNAGAFTPFAGGGATLELEIEKERLKELLGEGDRLFYLRAMQYPVSSGDRGTGAIAFPYDDLYWPLPPSETNLNPNAN